MKRCLTDPVPLAEAWHGHHPAIAIPTPIKEKENHD